jgi:hypothetical protein
MALEDNNESKSSHLPSTMASLEDINERKISHLPSTIASLEDINKSKAIVQDKSKIVANTEQASETKCKTNRDALFNRFKSLPTELLFNVLRLDIQHSMVEDCLNGAQLPMILQVLGREPDKIYAELLHEYNRTHARIDAYNLLEFNQRKLKNLLQLKHLTIVFPLGTSFKGQKITCVNELESIFFDYTLDRAEHNALIRLPDEKSCLVEELAKDEWAYQKHQTYAILRWIVLANMKSLKRLVMRVKMEECTRFIHCATRGLHLGPVKWQKGEFRYFVWEKKNGGVLTWDLNVFEPSSRTWFI